MKAELLWSLKKSIAAARGEEIEHADDLDKEIQLFVRENTGPTSASVMNDATKKQIYDRYIIPLMEILEERIGRFEPLFSVFHASSKASRIRDILSVESNFERPQWRFDYNLKKFKSDTFVSDILTEMTVTFGHDSFQIQTVIRSNNNNSMQYVYFPIHKYNASLESEATEKYSTEIVRAVFEVVKDYKLKVL